MNVTELVDVSYSPEQNKGLMQSFASAHDLTVSPRISRKLVLEKDEYNRFLKAKTRTRTQFETKADEIDLGFDSFQTPFEFIATKTVFVLKSGRTFEVFEELDKPNGLTKEIRVIQSLGQDIGVNVFKTYYEAEQWILKQLLEEK